MCGSCAKKNKIQQQFFFSAVLLQQKKKKKRRPDNPVLQQKRGSQIICFLGILLHRGFLIQIRFRRQFSGEIFINLS